MHELLAPLLYVVDRDAIDRKNVGDAIADPNMVQMLDSYFVEHDTFALFSKLMDHTKPFYEVSVDAGSPLSGEQSAIVEKSRMIHEVALMRIDPELAKHLQNIEILPQIFLMWVSLPFLSRTQTLTLTSINQSMDPAAFRKRVPIRAAARALGHDICLRPDSGSHRPRMRRHASENTMGL